MGGGFFFGFVLLSLHYLNCSTLFMLALCVCWQYISVIMRMQNGPAFKKNIIIKIKKAVLIRNNTLTVYG